MTNDKPTPAVEAALDAVIAAASNWVATGDSKRVKETRAALLALLRQPEAAPQDVVAALRLILPMAKGYANEHRVGRNAEFVEQAERALALLAEPRPEAAPDGWVTVPREPDDAMLLRYGKAVGVLHPSEKLPLDWNWQCVFRKQWNGVLAAAPSPTPATGEAIAHTADDLWLEIRFHTVNMDDDDLAEEIEFACVRAYKSLTKKYPDGWDNVTPPARPAQPTPAETLKVGYEGHASMSPDALRNSPKFQADLERVAQLRERLQPTPAPTGDEADCRELIREYLKRDAEARRDTNDAEEDAYHIGTRDGFHDAVQLFDLATGGDGEFKGSSEPGGTVDVPVMIRRIFARLARPNASAEPRGWQPIETCPIDGRLRLFGWNCGHVNVGTLMKEYGNRLAYEPEWTDGEAWAVPQWWMDYVEVPKACLDAITHADEGMKG